MIIDFTICARIKYDMQVKFSMNNNMGLFMLDSVAL